MSHDLGELPPSLLHTTMAFKECYLVPKQLYDRQVKMTDSTMPADVKIKLLDHEKRFGQAVRTTSEDQESQLERQMQTILDGVPDVTRRNLASQILTFIVTRGGGSVKWTDDFGVLLDNRRLYNLDIRKVIRHLVGADSDIKRESLPIYERLLSLGMKPTLLMFYDNPEFEDDDESDLAEKEDWDEEVESDREEKYEEANERWTDFQSSDPKIGEVHGAQNRLGSQRHPMTLRKKLPKWKTYRI